jgi:protein-tyrosine-phosphatase
LKNVLFLCTGNSARSILAEAYLNHAGAGRVRAYSAGSRPGGTVNPLAVELLRARGIDPGEPRSKSWDEFAAPGAPRMDLVVTVCDSAAGEACPVWPGAPARAHWGVDDPAAAQGSHERRRAAFAKAFADLKARIDAWLAAAQ